MRKPALIAAHQASDVVAALLLHDEEGHFGDIEVVEKFAEALIHTIDLRLLEVVPGDDDFIAALQVLKQIANEFIECWA